MKKPLLLFLLFSLLSIHLFGQAIIIDHHAAKLNPIPVWALQAATDDLHIAYGHTSHGSQPISGMTELENQDTMLVGYKGDYYCWNYYAVPGENGPCLDIHDQFRSGDLGSLGDTQWANSTRDYLENDPASADINVVMWSWCGGCSNNTVEGINTYLNTMSQLEVDYPEITFVYMTGHRDIWNRDTLQRNNQLIRDYCIENNKVLYDFADIESYDPDGVFYPLADDNCNYYNEDLLKIGNWANEWENSHTEGVDWFHCNAAHSQALNGNLKAYAAWWLWCRLAGWDGVVGIDQTARVDQEIQVYNIDKEIVVEAKSPSHMIVRVYNLMGNEVVYKPISARRNNLQTTLLNGIYLVHIDDLHGNMTTKKIYIP